MKEIVVNGLFTVLGILIGSVLFEKIKRTWNREDKEELREEEISREKILDHQVLAERMLVKVDKQEALIGDLRDNLAAKIARIAVLEIKLESAEEKLKRGE